ncbi:MAG TPA: hypothetical protein VGQ91_01285 [Ideonella sp.]|jgi:hypothetical protein|nr:hypothetical protein [Ideonella sp.]
MKVDRSIVRRAVALAGSLLALPASAQAPEITVPAWKAGDSWVYEITVGHADTCTTSLHTGSELRIKVLGVDAEGLDIERTVDGAPTQVRLAPDHANTMKVGAAEATNNSYGFPMRAGKTWQTGSVIAGNSGVVKSELKCEHQPMQKLALSTGEFDVVPIVCKGNWTNLDSRRSDQSIWKYWYAPAVGNHVRSSVLTYYQGRICSDLVWNLKAPKPASP